MEPSSRVKDGIAGTDFAVVRLRAHAIDQSFGTGGVAHASSMLVRNPIQLETVMDGVLSLALGSDGAPWMTGMSRAIETDERAYLRRVHSVIALSRFLP